MVWGAWKRPLVPLTMLLCQGYRVLPLETGLSLSHLDPIHILSLAVPVLARTKVWDSWIGADHQAVSAQL